MDKIKLAVKRILDNPSYLPPKKKERVKKNDIFDIKPKCKCKNKKKK